MRGRMQRGVQMQLHLESQPEDQASIDECAMKSRDDILTRQRFLMTFDGRWNAFAGQS